MSSLRVALDKSDSEKAKILYNVFRGTVFKVFDSIVLDKYRMLNACCLSMFMPHPLLQPLARAFPLIAPDVKNVCWVNHHLHRAMMTLTCALPFSDTWLF